MGIADATRDKSCLTCHSTGFLPDDAAFRGQDAETGAKQQGVSCIACHGAYLEWIAEPLGLTTLRTRSGGSKTAEQKQSGIRDDRPPRPRHSVEQVLLLPHRQRAGGQGRHAPDVRGGPPSAPRGRGRDLQPGHAAALVGPEGRPPLPRGPEQPRAVSLRPLGAEADEARRDRRRGRPARFHEAARRDDGPGPSRMGSRGGRLARVRLVRLLRLPSRPPGPRLRGLAAARGDDRTAPTRSLPGCREAAGPPLAVRPGSARPGPGRGLGRRRGSCVPISRRGWPTSTTPIRPVPSAIAEAVGKAARALVDWSDELSKPSRRRSSTRLRSRGS